MSCLLGRQVGGEHETEHHSSASSSIERWGRSTGSDWFTTILDVAKNPPTICRSRDENVVCILSKN